MIAVLPLDARRFDELDVGLVHERRGPMGRNPLPRELTRCHASQCGVHDLDQLFERGTIPFLMPPEQLGDVDIGGRSSWHLSASRLSIGRRK